MTQEYYNTKKRSFKHLTKEKRAQIEILLKHGVSKVQTAREAGISRSTLYNESARGTVEKVYYAHPCSAWEGGTNEKQNSLIRRFFPKGKNLDKISEEQVAYAENRINNLPRKIFNYSTSNKIFESVLFDIAI